MMKNKILLILTGGTICSFADNKGERRPDAKSADYLIKEIFKKSDSPYKDAEFDDKIPMNILSENMSPKRWNELIDGFREYRIENYRGVIILHGTDTLAYTSAMLSMVLAGVSVPVFMVSSQLPLNEKEANGNANFRVAVELIMKGIKPNVYVPYRNMDGKMLIHLGAHITQCPNFSNDFHSRDEVEVDSKKPEFSGVEYESSGKIIEKIGDFSASVLKIEPYVGLDYSRINLEGIKAVCHGTYHSETMSVSEDIPDEYSVFSLKECFSGEIPLFITPCRYIEAEKTECYETTARIVKKGGVPVFGMTSEMVYVKAMVGVALGLFGDKLKKFLKDEEINGEFHLS